MTIRNKLLYKILKKSCLCVIKQHNYNNKNLIKTENTLEENLLSVLNDIFKKHMKQRVVTRHYIVHMTLSVRFLLLVF